MKTKLILTVLLLLFLQVNAQHAPFANFNSSTNSYIDYGRGLNLNCFSQLSSGNKMTITFWIKWTNKSAAGVGNWANLFTLADSTGSGDNGVFWVQHNSANTSFEFALHTTSRQYIYSTTDPQNGHWYHIACVYDGSLSSANMKLYVDGVLESSLNKTGNIRAFPGASRLNMGRWCNSGNSYRRFNGGMDEVTVWNVALTSSQITNIMSDMESVTGSLYDATGLIGAWNFSDYTANDLSSCHNNGFVGSGAILPVELVSFNTQWNGHEVVLDWTTASEVNNDYFSIESSRDGFGFFPVGEVQGSGNSNRLISYSYADVPEFSGTLYYRLKQYDYDGKYGYSSVSAIKIPGAENSCNVFPNPASVSDNISLEFSEKTNFKVIDVNGKIIIQGTSEKLFMVPASLLEPGLYIVICSYENNVTRTKLMIN